MTAPNSPYINSVKELKDYYWSYADILRDIGINESTYDQRIMAFMALKLLIDNNKLMFNLEYVLDIYTYQADFTSYPKEEYKDLYEKTVSRMKNLSGDLTGQHSWLLSKIFLEITHQENIIAYGNTLTNPAFANGIDGKESFDFIIANPPFGVDWKHN